MSAVYQVSQDTLLSMAQAKVCEDLDKLGDFISSLAIPPNERQLCKGFGYLSTAELVREILMKERATDEQLAEGMRELRRRFLAEYEPEVSKEFLRLNSQEWS